MDKWFSVMGVEKNDLAELDFQKPISAGMCEEAQESVADAKFGWANRAQVV